MYCIIYRLFINSSFPLLETLSDPTLKIEPIEEPNIGARINLKAKIITKKERKKDVAFKFSKKLVKVEKAPDMEEERTAKYSVTSIPPQNFINDNYSQHNCKHGKRGRRKPCKIFRQFSYSLSHKLYHVDKITEELNYKIKKSTKK